MFYNKYINLKKIAVPSGIQRTADENIIEKKGCIQGLPIAIKGEDQLKSIKDESLPMFVFGSYYRMADGSKISLIYEAVLNEILTRENFFSILLLCLAWPDEYIVVLNKRELRQTCINLLDSAIARSRNEEQREAILGLRRSYKG